jgi:hypothetical protein
MAMAGKGAGFLVVVFVAGLFLQVTDAQTLRVGFYNQTCRTVESIVAEEAQRAASTDRTILASLIRLHFHDCFVNVRNKRGNIDRYIPVRACMLHVSLTRAMTGFFRAATGRCCWTHTTGRLRRTRSRT